MLRLHRHGKIEIRSTLPLTQKTLPLVYTPGVAEVCREISQHPQKVFEYTTKGNSVAIVTDGSRVLGLGNIGAEASLPVMEGKALLFKELAQIDAFPLCLNTQNSQEIIDTVRFIAPSFGGINLEDIATPRCFEIEDALQDLGIPVLHDDQHGTAIAVLAGLINACLVTKKRFEDLTVVINGAGAAGMAIARLLSCVHTHYTCKRVHHIVMCDREGIIYRGRPHLTSYKRKLLSFTNKDYLRGSLLAALNHADVFIGVSTGKALHQDMIRAMNTQPIIFALANPTPEIMPSEAYHAGAAIVATGRSDFPNQINNALVFPGFFRGLLDSGASHVTEKMKISAAYALAQTLRKPQKNRILPSLFDTRVVKNIARAVMNAA